MTDTQLTPATAKLPDFLKVKKPLGNENVDAQDKTIPRIKLLQKLSPELDSSSPNYIAGAKPGMIINTVTMEAFEELLCVNIFYRREFAVYADRQAGGGGFHGAFPTEAEALAKVKELGGDSATHVIRETGNHALLLLDADGNATMEAICLMDGSKLTVSNNWNTAIARIKDVDRFASVWSLGSTTQSNSKGSWSNYTVNFAGYVDEQLYKVAKALYDSIANPQEKQAA